MCKVLHLFYQCGHKKATIYPHTPCEYHLANIPLSGLDSGFKSNLRRCRISRVRKVKTLRDEFCDACDARICDLSPSAGARLARELTEVGELRGREQRMWLLQNVLVVQYLEDQMIEENVIDSEGSEMSDPLTGRHRNSIVDEVDE